MKISYSKNFVKQSKKLNLKLRTQLVARVSLFTTSPTDSQLNNHALKGKYKHYRSINITGDYRALYLAQNEEIIFDIIGTHSQLYG